MANIWPLLNALKPQLQRDIVLSYSPNGTANVKHEGEIHECIKCYLTHIFVQPNISLFFLFFSLSPIRLVSTEAI